MRYASLLLCGFISLLAWGSVQAAPSLLHNTDWELCGEPDTASSHPQETAGSDNDQNTYLSADESEVTANEIFNFSGDVLVRRAGRQIEADTAVYNKIQDTVDATGNVRLDKEGLSLQGSSAHVELGTEKGKVEDADYQLTDKHARGDASSITLEGPGLARLKGAKYTTCNPGNDDWYIHSSDIKLDQTEGVGTARNVWLEFKGVPFLYLPYMTFPLNDKRKSGFLTPSFGTSIEVGTEVLTPYYWNIAPNRDATITPRVTAKRGLHLLGEFRYLNATNAGHVDIGYLPNDNTFDGDRLFVSARHAGNFAPRWSTDINFNYVSDQNYFEELGTTLSASSITHLERRADVTYSGDFWTATGRVQGFQTVDESLPSSQRPYQRLPQLLLNGSLPQQLYDSTYLFNGEYVHFARQDSLTADRIDIQPGISLPLNTAAAYLTPTFALRSTQYALEDEASGSSNESSRALPIVSVDSGLTLERDVEWGSSKLLQTLEPRLFYLYVPFRDQAQIPVFDSGVLDFNFTQLFQTNRFSGGDRVGDANQLTLTLTSRLFDSNSGTERLNLKVGQIRYFRDRKVTLPGGLVDSDSSSDIIMEATSSGLINNWSANANLQWDTHNDRVARSALSATYQPDEKHILNLAYRFRNDELEQTDVSALWPLARDKDRHWNGVARWNYSFFDSRTLESLVGVEYDTCCWALRVAASRFVNDVGGDDNTALFVQLELKGLTSFGDKGKKGFQSLLEPRLGEQR